MKIALLGANGQLGYDLKRTLGGHRLTALTRSDFDVTDRESMSDHLSRSSPDAIINTTAFHQVDVCESEAGDAFRVNALAVFDLSEIANRLGATLVHISTDYVFDGEAVEPYTELSSPRPISVYANSKLAGEYFVRSVAQKHILIRTCGLYGVAGSAGKGGNFVETMLRKAKAGEEIRVVSDQVVTPTPTADLAKQMQILLEADHFGLFHCSSEGSCSWYEFAKSIFRLSGLDARLEPTTPEFHKTLASRPAYSVMENSRLKALGLNRMRHWRSGLADYLQEKHGIPALNATDAS